LNDKTVAVLGLAFKPDTDDIRYSPAMDIIDMLINKGARVKAYDPQAMIKAKNVYKKNQRVTFGKSLYDTVKGVQAVVIVTDWDEFRYMDLVKLIKLMKHPIIVDGRNMFDPAKMKTAGFIYKSIGRN
ncbi:MAG: UDP-glucose/GDP-mannose dehydrogenase family protein, partial [Elusimicrobiota bacterium]